MLSFDDFVTQMERGVRIKCNDVTERMDCL